MSESAIAKPARPKRPLLVDQLRELLRAQRKPIPNRDRALFDQLNDVANEHATLAVSKTRVAPKKAEPNDD